MFDNLKIEGSRVYLRKLLVKDISERYINWLNDPDVNKFLSTRSILQNYETVKEYILGYDREDGLLLGIFTKEDNLHIGNITLYNIDWANGFSDIGYSIGDKSYWRKGYAMESIKLIMDYAFKKLKFNRLEVGPSIKNVASVNLLKKLGFKLEGIQRKKIKIGEVYTDRGMFALLKEDCEVGDKLIFK